MNKIGNSMGHITNIKSTNVKHKKQRKKMKKKSFQLIFLVNYLQPNQVNTSIHSQMPTKSQSLLD